MPAVTVWQPGAPPGPSRRRAEASEAGYSVVHWCLRRRRGARARTRTGTCGPPPGFKFRVLVPGIIKIHSRPDSESGSHRVTAAAARGPGPGPGHPDEAQ